MSVLLVGCASDLSSHLDIAGALARAGWREKIAIVSPDRCTKVRLDAVCGLVLTDGDALDDRRDALEFPLIAWAWQRRLPLLALGRGAHIVNAARGGARRLSACAGSRGLGEGLCARTSAPRARQHGDAPLVMFVAEDSSRRVIGVLKASGALAREQLAAFVAEAAAHGMHADREATRRQE